MQDTGRHRWPGNNKGTEGGGLGLNGTHKDKIIKFLNQN